MQRRYIIWCHQKILRKKLRQGPGKQIHCVKSTKIRRFFLVCIFPYLDWMRTRKNSVFGHFWRNDYCNTFNLISFLRKILFFYKRLLVYMSWNSLDLKHELSISWDWNVVLVILVDFVCVCQKKKSHDFFILIPNPAQKKMIYGEYLLLHQGNIWTLFQCISTEPLQKTSALSFDFQFGASEFTPLTLSWLNTIFWN